MFFNSSNFKKLEAGVEMSWMKQQIHTQNLSNLETPGYKSKRLDFNQVFEGAVDKASSNSLSGIHVMVRENTETSLLQDGNNVNFEKENIELYKAYTQYSLLLDKINSQFQNHSTIINNGMK